MINDGMPTLADIFKDKSTPLKCIPTSVPPVLPVFSGIKAVVFDIYGTLFISGSGDIGISSAHQREEVLREFLAENLKCVPSTEKTLTGLLLKSIKQEHLKATSEGIPYPEVEIRDLWKKVLAPYITPNQEQLEELALSYEAMVNPIWPMPSLQEVLTTLNEKNVKLGIISNAQFYTPHLFPAFLEKSLADLNFSPDLCLYSYEERQAKPGVFLYEKLKNRLQKYAFSAEEVLYVGNDMRNDIAPAHEVGFKTVLFAGDQRSLRLREEMSLPEPDAVITDLPQLLKLL